jgi:hypothetical protein
MAKSTVDGGPDPGTIHSAQLEVMRKVDFVLMTGKMEAGGGRFKYASEADILKSIRKAMTEEGIVCTCSENTQVHTGAFASRKGGTLNHVRLKCVYKFTHVPSGTSDTCEAHGEGVDHGDKLANKAETMARKSALLTFFLLERDDDPDRVSSDELEAKERPGAGGTSYREAEDSIRRAGSPETLSAYERVLRGDNGLSPADKEELLAMLHEKRDTMRGREDDRPRGERPRPRPRD